MFAPNLEKVIDLTIQKAEAYGYEGEPYNALLDDYEPGTTVADVEAAFGGLRDDLVVLLDKIKGAPKKPDKSIVERAYDPVYGARPLKRFIQQHIETPAARMIVSGELGEGGRALVRVERGELALIPSGG